MGFEFFFDFFWVFCFYEVYFWFDKVFYWEEEGVVVVEESIVDFDYVVGFFNVEEVYFDGVVDVEVEFFCEVNFDDCFVLFFELFFFDEGFFKYVCLVEEVDFCCDFVDVLIV